MSIEFEYKFDLTKLENNARKENKANFLKTCVQAEICCCQTRERENINLFLMKKEKKRKCIILNKIIKDREKIM